jgi:membrane-bound metal-dependent hydrolase YbcI (DUF457 family)
VIFWHLGATVAIVRYAFRDERMDLRLLMIGALLPDVIDTPIGLAAFSATGGVRLVAHSLLAASAAMVAVLLRTRRGRPRKRWMPLAVGMLVHLFLDAMWADPETLWWPFLGVSFTAADAAAVGDYVSGVLTDWRVWALEGAGLLYLLALGRRAAMTTADARRRFVATGVVDAPIGPG